MKTNIIMHRGMGGLDVTQRTKDGMFNATHLAKQWNALSEGSRKDVSEFLSNKNTKSFIAALKEENVNTGIPVFTKNRGVNGGTWMNPLLFIDFAMWLNPKFKVKVLQFVYDQLIENRHIAGDNYKVLSSSASSLKGCDYSKIGKSLNWIVFGKHQKNIRNKATEDQLKELNQLQGNLAYAIDSGFINSFDELMKELRRLYNVKYNSKLKTA